MKKQHSLSIFSFVKAGPRGKIESMWNVKPSGDWEADYKQGARFADEVLKELPSRSAGLIAQIAQAVPRKFTGIEHGFCQTLILGLQL